MSTIIATTLIKTWLLAVFIAPAGIVPPDYTRVEFDRVYYHREDCDDAGTTMVMALEQLGYQFEPLKVAYECVRRDVKSLRKEAS